MESTVGDVDALGAGDTFSPEGERLAAMAAALARRRPPAVLPLLLISKEVCSPAGSSQAFSSFLLYLTLHSFTLTSLAAYTTALEALSFCLFVSFNLFL